MTSILKFATIASIGAILIVMTSLLPAQFDRLTPQVGLAQTAQDSRQPDRDNQAQQVYQQLPDLPLENQYVNTTTGRISTTSTLVSRLIDYHIYVRSRSPVYRLDWKLTLADYLGVNQWVNPATYPGNDSLRPNPVVGDLAAIDRLDRAQRDVLVAALVQAFGGASAPTANAAPVAPSPIAPVQTQPGAAQLLAP